MEAVEGQVENLPGTTWQVVVVRWKLRWILGRGGGNLYWTVALFKSRRQLSAPVKHFLAAHKTRDPQ